MTTPRSWSSPFSAREASTLSPTLYRILAIGRKYYATTVRCGRSAGSAGEASSSSSAATTTGSNCLPEQRTISSPLAGLIDDPAAELARLQKRKAKTQQDLGKEEGKLSNPEFVGKAPAERVAEVHTRVAILRRQVAEVEQQEQAVSALVAQRRA